MIHDNPELALEITSYLSHNASSETLVMSIFLSPSHIVKERLAQRPDINIHGHPVSVHV
jgi:hypothetical protein